MSATQQLLIVVLQPNSPILDAKADAYSMDLHLALYIAIPLCVLSVTRYQVYFADYDPR